MKGLMLDNYYKTIDGMKILLIFLVVAGGIILIFTDSQLLIQFFIILTFIGISVMALSGVRKDSVTRWNRYEVTLPVKRDTIVLVKYLSFVIWLLVATILVSAFITILVAYKGNTYFDFGLRDILTILSLSVSLSLINCTIYYLMMYLLEPEKSEILVIMCLIFSLFLTGLAIFGINLAGISITVGRLILLGTSILLFLLSYFISRSVYRKAEV